MMPSRDRVSESPQRRHQSQAVGQNRVHDQQTKLAESDNGAIDVEMLPLSIDLSTLAGDTDVSPFLSYSSEQLSARHQPISTLTRRKPLPPGSRISKQGGTSVDVHPPPADTEATSSLIPQESRIDYAESIESKGHSHEAKPNKHWWPFFLSRLSLNLHIGICVALLTALAILYAYSQEHHGLSSADTAYHYLWTYGPTAVFTILAAFWGQVEYQTKQLMPWRNMMQGPQPATRNLLLDYVSPWNLVVLWTSATASDYVVSLAVVASLLIKLLIVVSTGLFSLQYTTLSDHRSALITTARFSGASYDGKTVDVRPVSAIYAVRNLNVSYPAGTTAQYAIQPFSDLNGSNSTLTATVDVFSASLECENASLTLQNISYQSSLGGGVAGFAQYLVNVETPTCQALNISINGTYTIKSADGNVLDPVYGIGRIVDCSNLSSSRRIMLSVGQLSSIPCVKYPCAWQDEYKIQRSTSLLCKPEYSIRKAAVTLRHAVPSGNGIVSIMPSAEGNTTLPQVDAWAIAEGVFGSIESSTSGIVEATPGSGNITTLDTFSALLALPFAPQNESLTSRYWTLPANLEKAGGQLYGSLAAQLASQQLLASNNRTLTGTSTATRPRLFLRTVSFAIMVTLLCFLIISVILLHIYTHQDLVPRDPGSIAGTAVILSRSPDSTQLLEGMGSSEIVAIREKLRGYSFSTRVVETDFGRAFTIMSYAEFNSKTAATPAIEQSARLRWWRPLSYTLPFWVLIMLLPVAGIITLELLLEYSRRNDGIASVSSDGYIHYTWTLIPALIMTGISLLFNMLDFNTKVFQPFAVLRKGTASATRTLLHRQLGNIALQGLWIAVKKRQPAVFATTFATLLAPLLAIAVSGLYTAQGAIETVSLAQRTVFSFNESTVINTTVLSGVFEYVNSANLSLLTDLIVEANLSYPAWTFGEIAFPVLNIPGNSFNTTSSSLTARVPGVRASLDCLTVPTDRLNFTVTTELALGLGETNASMVEVNVTMPDGCGAYCPGKSSGTGKGTRGYCQILYFTTPGAPHQSAGRFGALGNAAVWDESCPLVGGIFGIGTDFSTYTTLLCKTYVQRLSVDTTFDLPNFTISPQHLPQPIENSATTLSGVGGPSLFANVLNNSTDLLHGPNAALLTDIASDGLEPYLSTYAVPGSSALDPFFSAVVYSASGTPAPSLAGPENIPRLIAACQHLFRVLMAQVISTNHRTADPDLVAGAEGISATLTTPTPTRLKQSAISTRILEGILATLLLCALTTWLLLDTRQVLPKNPCSIAAVASLLAGSDVLTVPGPGAEWCDDNKLRELYEGHLFSMGWWDRTKSSVGRFGIGIGRADG